MMMMVLSKLNLWFFRCRNFCGNQNKIRQFWGKKKLIIIAVDLENQKCSTLFFSDRFSMNGNYLFFIYLQTEKIHSSTNATDIMIIWLLIYNSIIITILILYFLCLICYRSLPKLSSQDEEGGAGHGFGGGINHFEPIPHDHDFCERVVINVSKITTNLIYLIYFYSFIVFNS